MDDSTVFDALAPDSQSGSEGFQGIDILPFLFPVQVEPEYESFRVNFCDRLLGELYTAQRQRRIQEIRRNIARSLDLAAGSETLSLSNGTADDGDAIETKTVAGRPSTKEESSAFLPKSSDALKESEGLPPLQTSFLCDTPLSIFCSPSPTVCKLSPASMTCSWAMSSEARDATTRAIVGRSSPPMSTRIGRSTLLSSTFHLSCLTENGTAPPTAGLSTEDKKPISIDTTMEETTDDYDALGLVESSRNPLEEDDHSTADIYPTPAVRYGRNSGMRRLEDLKRRLQDDAFHHHRSTLLEEEVRWELRLPICYRWRRCGGARVVDDGVSPTAPLSTMSTDSFRESKWFHFGNRWWVMHFGITASSAASVASAASAASAGPGAAGAAVAAVASDADGKTEDVFCYLHVCPAERLLEPAYVAMECWLFPSALSASSSSVPNGHHRRDFPSDVCFGCVDSGEEGIPQQQHGGGKGPTGAVQGWDRFIATDQLPLYVNDDGKIQLTLIMRSRLGAHGQLLGSN